MIDARLHSQPHNGRIYTALIWRVSETTMTFEKRKFPDIDPSVKVGI